MSSPGEKDCATSCHRDNRPPPHTRVVTVTSVDDHPSIDDYLHRAHRRWSDDGDLPHEDDLRSIARDCNMSEEASEKAHQQALELTQQARQALERGETDEAEQHLRDAVLLSPVEFQPHLMLGQLYARRYAEHGEHHQREQALQLARRAQKLAPDDVKTRALLQDLGTAPQDSLPWKKAALIVLVIVAISGTMQLCHRYFIAPEVTDEQTERVREYFEEHGPPPR